MSVCDEYSKEGEASELREGVFQATDVQKHVHMWCIGRIEGQLARCYGFINKVFRCRYGGAVEGGRRLAIEIIDD